MLAAVTTGVVSLVGVPLVGQQEGQLGEGTIDNFIIQPWVHRLNGALAVAALLATAGWLTLRALRHQPFDRTSQILIAASQVFLMIQALLGVKLLDQGMGVVQLYIHYVGGLLPLGFFLVLGWIRFADPVRRTRVLALAVDISFLSALMAFVIGQAYVNQ